MEQLGAGSWTEGVEALANSALEFMVGGYADLTPPARILT